MKARVPTGPLEFTPESKLCTVRGCNETVARGTDKPFCKDHVLSSPYARKVAGQIARLSSRERKKA